MDREEFNDLLKQAGLNKRELSDLLETTYQGVNNWGTNGRGYPYWVKSWLENYIKSKTLDTVVEAVKPYVKD